MIVWEVNGERLYTADEFAMAYANDAGSDDVPSEGFDFDEEARAYGRYLELPENDPFIRYFQDMRDRGEIA